MHPSPAELTAEHVLLTAAIILGLGSILGFIARKARVPDIVLYLLAGIVLGPQVTGVLNISPESSLSWIILIFGASYILFDGGAMLRIKYLKEIWISLTLIVSLGVIVTALITGVAAFAVLTIPLTGALLLGAAVAATDPAALVVVFKKLNIKQRVAQFVVSESAFNDPVGTIITIAFLTMVTASATAAGHGAAAQFSLRHDLITLVRDLGFGVAVGIAMGYIASQLVAHEKLGVLQDYLPVVSVIIVIGAYLTAQVGLSSSGFMAAFIAGLVVGNMEMFGIRVPEKEHARLEDFVETTSMMARMFIFFLLGSQVQLDLVRQYWWEGLIVVGVLMFVARPFVVFLCGLPDRRTKWTFKEMLFLSWTRETGVIPGTLASILVAKGVPNAKVIAAIIFIVIVVTICVQAPTAKLLAQKLDLMEEPGNQPDAEDEFDDAAHEVRSAVDDLESALDDMRSAVDSIDTDHDNQPRATQANPAST